MGRQWSGATNTEYPTRERERGVAGQYYKLQLIPIEDWPVIVVQDTLHTCLQIQGVTLKCKPGKVYSGFCRRTNKHKSNQIDPRADS